MPGPLPSLDGSLHHKPGRRVPTNLNPTQVRGLPTPAQRKHPVFIAPYPPSTGARPDSFPTCRSRPMHNPRCSGSWQTP